MKTISAILILITIINCNGQHIKMEKMENRTFNIERFNKNKDGNSYFFKDNQESLIKQYGGNDSYWETVQYKNEILEVFYEYYKDGNLQRSVKRYPNAFALGVLKEYDKQGNVIKEENLDKAFLFSWEKIKMYLKEHDVKNFENQVIGISRFTNDNVATWTLEFNGTYNTAKGRYKIILNGKTGEEQEVQVFKGKDAIGETGTVGVYETIFEIN